MDARVWAVLHRITQHVHIMTVASHASRTGQKWLVATPRIMQEEGELS